MNRLLSKNESDFIRKGLNESGIRIDGRSYDEYRKTTVEIEFGAKKTANNNHDKEQNANANESVFSAFVNIGKTKAVAFTRLRIVAPAVERPNEGILQLGVKLSMMASPFYAEESESENEEKAIEIGRILERAFRESRAIDMETLCIVPGEKVWGVRCDVVIVDDDGNLIDAACLAALSSLRHAKHNDVTVMGSNVTIHSFDDKQGIPLNLLHFPFAVTFAFLDVEGKLMLLDPSDKEERIMCGYLTLIVNNKQELCAINKSGGTLLTIDQIMSCAKLASVKAKSVLNDAYNKATQS